MRRVGWSAIAVLCGLLVHSEARGQSTTYDLYRDNTIFMGLLGSLAADSTAADSADYRAYVNGKPDTLISREVTLTASGRDTIRMIVRAAGTPGVAGVDTLGVIGKWTIGADLPVSVYVWAQGLSAVYDTLSIGANGSETEELVWVDSLHAQAGAAGATLKWRAFGWKGWFRRVAP